MNSILHLELAVSSEHHGNREETAPCFIVRDANGQALAFVYCEDEPGRRTTGKLLTRDEARRIAVNIAKAAGFVAAGRLKLQSVLSLSIPLI
jgi:hypothetical protein